MSCYWRWIHRKQWPASTVPLQLYRISIILILLVHSHCFHSIIFNERAPKNSPYSTVLHRFKDKCQHFVKLCLIHIVVVILMNRAMPWSLSGFLSFDWEHLPVLSGINVTIKVAPSNYKDTDKCQYSLLHSRRWNNWLMTKNNITSVLNCCSPVRQTLQMPLNELESQSVSGICLQSEKTQQMWYLLEHTFGHSVRNSPLTGWAAIYKLEPPAVAFLRQLSLSLLCPICVCVCSFYFKNKDNWVCVITQTHIISKNDLILGNNYIKMQKTAQKGLGFLSCWVGTSYRTLCWVNITLSVVEFVCSKQQTTREDVSAAVA